MKPYSTAESLPEDKTYVLIHVTLDTWHDADDQENLNWRVAKFVRGISIAEREALPEGHPRKRIYTGADEGGNNKKPYAWEPFGPGSFFGQDVDYWAYLPKIPKTD